MKRLIMLIITLIILTNVSYAAFPIMEGLHTEILQIPPVEFNDPIDTWTLILTIVWPVLFYVFHIPIYEWTICIKSLWFISSTCFSPIFIAFSSDKFSCENKIKGLIKNNMTIIFFIILIFCWFCS